MAPFTKGCFLHLFLFGLFLSPFASLCLLMPPFVSLYIFFVSLYVSLPPFRTTHVFLCWHLSVSFASICTFLSFFTSLSLTLSPIVTLCLPLSHFASPCHTLPQFVTLCLPLPPGVSKGAPGFTKDAI